VVPDDITARFAALVAATGDGLPLDEACLLIAAHAIDDLDEAAERDRLDELAEGVETDTPFGVVDHLCRDLGFAGDRDTYYDIRNSLLPAVLDRRLGIPISLAVVAMEVGRRRGVTLRGVGMPGHFLVCSEHDRGQFVDLYAGGEVLDADACRQLFTGMHPRVPWEDRFLTPVSAPAIVARVLTNLAGAYRRAGQRQDLAWALDLRLRLPGAPVRDRRELVAVLTALGRFDEAASVVEAGAEGTADVVARRLRARLN
jgi:regulator of sirC expression with transglutaminase-like and TPR domain